MMKINLVYNKKIADYKDYLFVIENVFIEKKLDFKSFDLDSMQNYGDITIVIGGDGSLLKAARFYSAFKVPVLGLNQGRLGFLSQADIDEYKMVLEAVLENKYFVEERMMLHSEGLLALNDFVIKGADLSRSSKFYLKINEREVCNYIADGLIVSTPTGSTAYGLSAGGPIIYPTLDSIIIVPICPHTLNARPLVVPVTENIKIETEEEPFSVSADGILSKTCYNEILIKKAQEKARLAFLRSNQFYTILNNKLNWGIPPRK